MLEPETAYPITESNANVLSHISGFQRSVLKHNIGWCMVYSLATRQRWTIVPRSVAEANVTLKIDEETYTYPEEVPC